MQRGISFQKGLAYLDRRRLGMSVEEYRWYAFNNRWRKQIFLDENQKVRLPNIEYCFVNGCNFRCEHCHTFSPFRQGISPKDEVIDSLRHWGQRLFPQEVRLLGGETFLHPHIAEIAAAAKAAFPDAKTVIYTNGSLISNIQNSKLQAIHDIGVLIRISKHMDTPDYNRGIQQSILRLREFQVSYEVLPSNIHWRTCYGIDRQGVPVPAQSRNLESTFCHCGAKYCPAIHRNSLYFCSHLENTIRAFQEGAIGLEWHQVLKHQPVTLESTPQEILHYLRGGAMAECSICPEKPELTEARQLTGEEVRVIKERIREEKRKAA
ncbi:MAG: radical SAM protein [Planctomycetaceae bacterium]|jgi:hypothetical protein|nr:radical SAM protein [Planctomycetaceae bacterium]